MMNPKEAQYLIGLKGLVESSMTHPQIQEMRDHLVQAINAGIAASMNLIGDIAPDLAASVAFTHTIGAVNELCNPIIQDLPIEQRISLTAQQIALYEATINNGQSQLDTLSLPADTLTPQRFEQAFDTPDRAWVRFQPVGSESPHTIGIVGLNEPPAPGLDYLILDVHPNTQNVDGGSAAKIYEHVSQKGLQPNSSIDIILFSMPSPDKNLP